MSKVLVVVYSHTGTSRRLSEQLCNQLGWQLAEIVEERPRRGIPGIWRCVLDSLLQRRPAIRYDGPFPKKLRRGRPGVADLARPAGRTDAQLRHPTAGPSA